MPQIATKHGVLTYDVHGDGPPVVLLRGLGRTVRHWLGYEKVLAQKAQVKVIVFDLRGIGASTKTAAWTDSMFHFAEDIGLVLDHLGIKQAHIMGVSLGGMVTLAFGLKSPERCLSLIVMNASIAGQRTLRLSPKALVAIVQAARYRDIRFHAGLVKVLVSPSCPSATQAEITRHYMQVAAEDGLFVWTVVKQIAAAARFLAPDKLRRLQVPTLVIYGTDDQFVPNINSIKLAKLLPRGRLINIPGAGHEISLDKPAELAAALASWVGTFDQQPA